MQQPHSNDLIEACGAVPIPIPVPIPVHIPISIPAKRGRKVIERSNAEILELHKSNKIKALQRYYDVVKPANDLLKPIVILQQKYDELYEKYLAVLDLLPASPTLTIEPPTRPVSPELTPR
jgi:hypothetical protein